MFPLNSSNHMGTNSIILLLVNIAVDAGTDYGHNLAANVHLY